jgi:DNA-directed RNA polymerase specialized sigma24 family protein
LVTHWVGLLTADDHAAAQPLWEAYCRRLAGVARQKLGAAPRRAADDEEDVALSAFGSLCRGAKRGRFPLLRDRDDLWHLLVVLTARKAWRLAKHEARQKRGGGKVLAEADLAAGAANGDDALARALGQEPAPDFAAQVVEECRRLRDRLGDAELRSIALWKMECYTNEEIAGRLGCASRTVERKLGRIRVLWSDEAPS